MLSTVLLVVLILLLVGALPLASQQKLGLWTQRITGIILIILIILLLTGRKIRQAHNPWAFCM